ncbi:MAG: 16S rRNA (adenine(1518)-N(6)/adenine(1519)-N(6))-dimethyltransferase RsmA [Planctomycetota bacterium]
MGLNKQELLELFRARNLRASQTLGQNFLLDTNFINFIIKTAELTKDDSVLEIGSGPGILTHLLANEVKQVWAVEIDADMMQIARDLYGALDNVEFIQSNILAPKEVGLSPEVLKAIKKVKNLKVVSNLPYKTAVPIIMLLLESGLPISRLLVMVQLEIAQRLMAPVGAHNYSSVSILSQYLAEVKMVKKVPPDVFWPRPEVQSALIEITPVKTFTAKFMKQDYGSLKRFLKLIFSYRRKIVGRAVENALANLEVKVTPGQIGELLAASGIRPDLRPQQLTPEDYLRLYDKFKNMICHWRRSAMAPLWRSQGTKTRIQPP